MGNWPSNEQPAAEAPPAKADYYDLLGVERTATEDELKKAYRRKALELHPDRNYGNVDEATKLFADVQTAYEVLSDPHERAWYDSHRDVLLRGDGPSTSGQEFSYNVRMTTAVDIQQLMLRFNGNTEFSNGPKGFYGGLNDFFGQLAREEDIACQWENQDPMDYPDFGRKDDDYEDVVRPFYSAWTGFATKKGFSWKDQYRLSDAPDRRIRRLMEKENKKLRDEAIQEYNESVRTLIAFVRKRDPRVQNNQKSEAERQKALRDAAAAQAARSKAQRDAQLRNILSDFAAVPDWAQSQGHDEHAGGFSSESEVETHEYECVVCDKTFKSEAQFKAHEKSKKHVKLLKQLRKEMRDEDAYIPRNEQAAVEETEEGDDRSPADPDVVEEPTEIDVSDSQEDEKANGRSTAPSAGSSEPDASDDDDYVSREALQERLAGKHSGPVTAKLAEVSLEGTPATTDTESAAPATSKVGKAKQKRAKKLAQQAAEVAPTTASEFQCMRCGNDFSGKNQLFKHLRDNPSHAAPVQQAKASKGGKGKKR